MSLPATGTRPVTAILVALACGGLAAIVAPRYADDSAVSLAVTVLAAVLGFAAVYAVGRRGGHTEETRGPRT